MIVHFNIMSGSRFGKIQKLDSQHRYVDITVDDARDAWNNKQITDCNLAFDRLARQFDFDVKACLKWYEERN